MYSDDEYPMCFDNRQNFFAGCPQARCPRDTHLRGARSAEDDLTASPYAQAIRDLRCQYLFVPEVGDCSVQYSLECTALSVFDISEQIRKESLQALAPSAPLGSTLSDTHALFWSSILIALLPHRASSSPSSSASSSSSPSRCTRAT